MAEKRELNQDEMEQVSGGNGNMDGDRRRQRGHLPGLRLCSADDHPDGDYCRHIRNKCIYLSLPDTMNIARVS